jgi:hypothetical protein
VKTFFRLLAQARTSFQLATASLRSLPDFLVIGAQRTGSSTVYNSLIQHPSVMPAIYKEIHYFDINFWRGVKWYKSHFPLTTRRRIIRSLSGRQIITGEASPYYLFHPAVPQRIRRILPDAKFIVLLRNPVNRAYSHYHFMVAKGHEHLTFEDAIRVESDRLKDIDDEHFNDPNFFSASHRRYSYLARGRYAEQLRNWFKWFSKEQFLIVQSESLFNNAHEVLQEVGAFLNLSAPSSLIVANKGSYSKMSVQTRKQLLAYFEPYNQNLFDLLGRQFDW